MYVRHAGFAFILDFHYPKTSEAKFKKKKNRINFAFSVHMLSYRVY